MASVTLWPLGRAAALLCAIAFTAAAPAQEESPQDTQPPSQDGPAAAEPAAPDAADPEATPSDAAAPPAESGTVATIPVGDEQPAAGTSGPNLSYTFAAAGFTHVDYELSGLGFDALGAKGSFALGEKTYALLGYVAGELNDTGSTELSQYTVGAGFRQSLTQSMDLNVSFSTLLADHATADDRRNEVGYSFDAGVRAVLLPALEGSAALRYSELERNGHGFIAASAFYALLPRLSLGAEAVVGNSSTAYSALGRWAF